MPKDEELLTEDSELEGEEVEQEEEVSQEDEDGDSASESDAHGEKVRKPFLEVDERTKYATREDAIKGIGEAGKRIAALSAWEKELKEYGVSDPAEVRAYLDELIESRQTAAQLQAELKKLQEEREKATSVERETATRVAGEAKLTKEEKEAVAWLKEQLPGLGLISKDEAMKLIDKLNGQVGKIDKIEQYISQAQARERQSLIQTSRTELKSQMEADGYTDNEEGSLRLLIESSIKDWIDSDPTGRRSQRFYEGDRAALIQEGYERAKVALGMIKTSQGSNYVKNKAEALKRNAKAKLPTQGVAEKGRVAPKAKKRFNASGKRDFIGEKHNDAWEVAKKYFSNDSEEA